MSESTQAGQPREVSAEDKALAADWFKRIESALARPGIKEAHKQFEENRKLLRGAGKDGKRMQWNGYFANLASMRPQVYAKDPEFACQPSRGVPEESLPAVRKFCETVEAVLHECLVKETRLKKRAKRLLTSAYTTSVGWWKLCWQEDKRTDPLIQNQIKDTQDNLMRLENLQKQLADPSVLADQDLQIAKLRETLKGLEVQQEVTVARGLTLDFVMSEDVLILDPGVRELGDYERATAIGHRVWMGREAYRARFGYACDKGKGFSEASGSSARDASSDKRADLLCVWEIWDQESNRVFHVCDGEEGFCEPPTSPDWCGERWYPFFCMAFNEIEGTFYPLSDIELTQPQIEEINTTAADFKRDRKAALPLNIARKGGSLTDEDLKRVRDREGSDLLLVEGIGGQPLSNDIWSGQLAQLKPENYDTSQARSFMEQLIGGGDAARGSVLKAKTATEAEILSQGLRTRSAERQDTMEDMLSEVANYALQVLLRKLSPQEVQRIAGRDAQWPTLSADEVFRQVTVEVRGGSTGKPDRLQEQDRWTKLLPVIEKTVQQVAELRMNGQDNLAEALIELTRETLRRFDERLDIEQYLPPAPTDGKPDPAQAMQQLQMLKQQMGAMEQELKDAKDKTEKGYISAAASVATSANPLQAAQAFGVAIKTLEGQDAVQQDPVAMMAAQANSEQMMQQAQQMVAQLNDEIAQLQQQLQAMEQDRSAEIEKTQIGAQRDIEVARIKAPIEASAKVEAARITAEAAAASKAAEVPAMEAKEPVQQGPSELASVLQQLTDAQASMQALLQQVATPKAAGMRVVEHVRGQDGKIAKTILMPET